MTSPDTTTNSRRYLDLFKVFLKLGVIGFGGPAAHIAMMQQEVVERRKWLTHQEFLDLVGATNLIPGPNSTEMAIHVGWLRGRWLGLLIAGLSFILPAAAITAAIAWAYVEYGSLPQAQRWLFGIKPAVLAVIAGAIWTLGRAAMKDHRLILLGAIVAIAAWTGVSEIAALLGGGVLGMAWLRLRDARDRGASRLGAIAFLVACSQNATRRIACAADVGIGPATWPAAAPPALTVPVTDIGLVFLKIGSVLYGSGYVLVAFLQDELVDQRGWLTQQQLLDAVAAGQITPGPLFTTSTFVGYVAAGWPGAIAATVGIFLPSFVFVVLLSAVLPHLRKWTWTAAFLDAINVSAVALMMVVAVRLGQTTLVNWPAWLIAAAALAAVVVWKINALWLVLAGAAAGAALWPWAGA